MTRQRMLHTIITAKVMQYFMKQVPILHHNFNTSKMIAIFQSEIYVKIPQLSCSAQHKKLTICRQLGKLQQTYLDMQ